MLQAILYGAGDLRLENHPLDASALQPDQVYVQSDITALSTGTDLGNYLGRSQDVPGAPAYPRWVGYSNVGIVRKTGSAVTNLTPGTRVFAAKPHQSAYIAKATDLLVPVPENVSSEQASLIYLTELGVAALRHANYQAGESVAVVGLGVIGLGTCAIAKAMGANVTAVANNPLRAQAALNVGAHQACTIGQDPLPKNIDLIVLTANSWQAYRDSVEMARYGGRVSILGFPGRGLPAPDFNPLAAEWFYGKQLTLIGAGFAPRTDCQPADIPFNLRRNLEFILRSMSTGAVNLEPIITHRFPGPRMVEAYELAKSHSKELMAAVFDWRDIPLD